MIFNRKTLGKRGLVRNLMLLAVGVAGHYVIHGGLMRDGILITILDRVDLVYIVIVTILIFNSLLMMFLDYYSHTDKSRNRPLKALVQAVQKHPMQDLLLSSSARECTSPTLQVVPLSGAVVHLLLLTQ